MRARAGSARTGLCAPLAVTRQAIRRRTGESREMNVMTIDAQGWRAAGDAGLADAIELRRAIHAEPELGLDLPQDHRQGQGRAGRPAAGDPRGPLDQRGGGDPARTSQRAHGAAARRHGRPAADRGHRPALHLPQRRRHARLRPRHPRGHAGRRRARPVRAARAPRRHGDVHVPAGRGGAPRRPFHAGGRADRSRCPTPPSPCTSRPTCPAACSPAAPARCWPRPTR